MYNDLPILTFTYIYYPYNEIYLKIFFFFFFFEFQSMASSIDDIFFIKPRHQSVFGIGEKINLRSLI